MSQYLSFESSEFQSYHLESGTLDVLQWHIGRFLLWDYVFGAGLLLTSFKCKQKCGTLDVF